MQGNGLKYLNSDNNTGFLYDELVQPNNSSRFKLQFQNNFFIQLIIFEN